MTKGELGIEREEGVGERSRLPVEEIFKTDGFESGERSKSPS